MAANKAANEKGKRDKVVLAYSGGLDTSVDIHSLQENYDVDVVAISVDVGPWSRPTGCIRTCTP